MHDNITVLVIDDDVTIRTLLESTLFRKGFNVLSAEGGTEGLEIAAREHVDVILLDWMMPEMDGMEVLAELKRNSETMFIPVFMLTSKEDPKDIDLAISKGVVDYIIKPFNIYEVPEMVSNHIEKIHAGVSSGKEGFFHKLFSHKK